MIIHKVAKILLKYVYFRPIFVAPMYDKRFETSIFLVYTVNRARQIKRVINFHNADHQYHNISDVQFNLYSHTGYLLLLYEIQ